jgi:predicted nucleic acid-binding protein
MSRTSLDSNILIYAALEPQSSKGQRARDNIVRATPRGILANQALLEFVAVVRRRAPDLTEQSITQADAWSKTFETAATSDRVVADALALVQTHQFQVWDAVIWTAARHAGASVFFTEDLQHGFAKDGMRAVNPFLADEAQLHSLIGS